MTKDEQEKTKAYLKKMRKALKKAPIVLQLPYEKSPAMTDYATETWEQLNWTEDMRLQSAKEKLFSRLGKDDREKAHEWVFRHARLVGGDE